MNTTGTHVTTARNSALDAAADSIKLYLGYTANRGQWFRPAEVAQATGLDIRTAVAGLHELTRLAIAKRVVRTYPTRVVWYSIG